MNNAPPRKRLIKDADLLPQPNTTPLAPDSRFQFAHGDSSSGPAPDKPKNHKITDLIIPQLVQQQPMPEPVSMQIESPPDIPQEHTPQPINHTPQPIINTPQPIINTPQPIIPQSFVPAHGPLHNISFVMIGVFRRYTNEQYKKLILSLNGSLSSQVSKRVKYLVHGHTQEDGRDISTNSRFRQAKSFKVPIKDESQFINLLESITHQPITTLIIESPIEQQMDLPPLQQSTPPPINNKIEQQLSQANRLIHEEPPRNLSTYNPGLTRRIPKVESTPIAEMQVELPEHNDALWADKYAPRLIKDIMGNQHLVRSLESWLKDWNDVHLKGNKKQVHNPKNNINAKAVLLSGPPGIGKSTSVQVVAHSLDMTVIASNASDVRNKESIDNQLKHLTDNNLIGNTKKFLILMDEVDGMSSGDRGGSKALIDIIKQSRRPIVCICNDRMSPKVKSLAYHCLDLRFQKPCKQQVAKRVLEVFKQEQFYVKYPVVDLICETLNSDLRQVLNYCQLKHREMKNKGATTLHLEDVQQSLDSMQKDQVVMVSNFEAANRLFSRQFLKGSSFHQQLDMFFVDYDLVPMLIQENYPSSFSGSLSSLQLLQVAAMTDSMVQGDLLINRIKYKQEWTLLPEYGFYSTVQVAPLMGDTPVFAKFPSYLGKMSASRKTGRLLREAAHCLGDTVSVSRESLRHDYLPALFLLIRDTLKHNVDLAFTIMQHYSMSPDFLRDTLAEVQYNPKSIDLLACIPKNNKATLTRLYNQNYKQNTRKGKQKRKDTTEDEEDEEELR